MRQKLVQVVAMQSIEYLERGGRIGDGEMGGNPVKSQARGQINHKTVGERWVGAPINLC